MEMLRPAKTVELFQRPPSPEFFVEGERIFEEGEPGQVMYGILAGEVEMYVNGKVVETLATGDVFGERALLHEEYLRASTAVAKTSCKLAFLDRKHFLFAVQQTPMFAIEVMKSYSERLRRLKHSL